MQRKPPLYNISSASTFACKSIYSSPTHKVRVTTVNNRADYYYLNYNKCNALFTCVRRITELQVQLTLLVVVLGVALCRHSIISVEPFTVARSRAVLPS